jgi:hypothetical protein
MFISIPSRPSPNPNPNPSQEPSALLWTRRLLEITDEIEIADEIEITDEVAQAEVELASLARGRTRRGVTALMLACRLGYIGLQPGIHTVAAWGA